MSSDGRPICRHAASCYNRDPEHRKNFYHPGDEHGLDTTSTMSQRWRACRYGFKCGRRDPTHLAQFAHPGDRSYRNGLVVFEQGHLPQFETLWQLFIYIDVNESGYLDFSEFRVMHDTIFAMVTKPLDEPISAEDAWHSAVGTSSSKFMNFMQFVEWAEDLGIGLPVGIDGSGAEGARACRFSSKHGSRCSCPAFRAVPGQDLLCLCGHKTSMHRTECAQRKGSDIFSESVRELHWTSGATGLVKIMDEKLLLELQDMLVKTHKTTDNWTRDRGCSLHGVNRCATHCVMKNRAPVPTEYVLHRAYRNQNADLWAKYSLCRTAISEECRRDLGEAKFTVRKDIRSSAPLDSPLELENCNEWRLLHGTSLDKAKAICETNFSVHLAGTGATWKDLDKDKGVPLYGFGIYLAERVTKADEYAQEISEGERYGGMLALLVCRVVGGRTNVVTSNAIDTEKLRTDVFDGPYHSVLGDRVASLGKPYREVVVYDNHQVFPEFVLIYSRKFD